jgi:hypothetical protein
VVAEFQLPIDNNTCTENLVLEELIGQLQAFGFVPLVSLCSTCQREKV